MIMPQRKCKAKDCDRMMNILSDDDPTIYCSIECACYDGTYDIRTGWKSDPKTIKPNECEAL